MKGAISKKSGSPPSIAQGPLKLQFEALTPNRWRDLEQLFGPRGACAGCWCMWWRMKRSQFKLGKGEKNKKAFKRVVASGQVSGIIAYSDAKPVGWCALAPREEYPVLENSRILAPIDEEPVWSVVCFFVARPYRSRGITSRLLKAAIAYARKQGARIIEGYPVDPKNKRMPDVFVYTGLAPAFRAAGFVEVLRRSETRPIMRYVINPRKRASRD
jgi:GNAT superfamily N-acetyltransferase